ncbi:Ferric reductase domain protein transmembrane component domain protein [Actibacterium atlanticum]|uniref:Ferric reductase domain protein transmembrane component domain protein n=1 Tax=Actibacterium atlanticum TaxID=1461693 RepID=A0A058ZHT3_9RHOB|nr:ferredoxin reductase family protein [Actibacterium atlanticum]KCV80775.1 Ferric reductase domain protein transmembrane component domain protein [Actibacterium atlanticum]
MKLSGLLVILVALLVPFIWWPQISQNRDVIALGSQYLGLMSLICMALGQIIATRWPGIEALFGPMDQSYRLHKWLGLGGVITLLLHDTIDAEMKGLGKETVIVEAAETAGEISLYGILIFVVITVATFIPYHLWKWTHRLIGLFFVAGGMHYLFILKPFKNGDPLGLYMYLVMALGTIAYIYTSAPRGIRPGRKYQVDSITPQGDALAVEMSPKGGALKHKAGQFAFFAFTDAGYTEPHPFTISSAPKDDGKLRITVAPLGDFTMRLRQAVGAGQAVRVQGPYGHFGRGSKKPEIWVAAGVGVTPFVALAQALKADGPAVQMIFAVRNADQAPHLAELQDLAAANPRLSLTLWESSKSGRLTGDKIAEIAGGDLKGTRVSFCGPSEMRRALSLSLAGYGVSGRNFHFEAFEIRTGLGLKRFGAWLLKRAQQAKEAAN